MFTRTEQEWLKANENRFSTAMKKFIIFMYRTSAEEHSLNYYASIAIRIEDDMKEYRQGQVFGDVE